MADKGSEKAAVSQMREGLVLTRPGMGGGERGEHGGSLEDWEVFPGRGQSLPKCDGGGVAEATGRWVWREMMFPMWVVNKEGSRGWTGPWRYE